MSIYFKDEVRAYELRQKNNNKALERFKSYRASLPWFRRALLLYKAPNIWARFHKVFFYFNSCVALFTLFIDVSAAFGLHPLHGLFANAAIMHHRDSVDVFIDQHGILWEVFVWSFYVVGSISTRFVSIWYETSPSAYPQDAVRDSTKRPQAPE